MPTPAEILYGDAGYTGATVDAGSVTRFADPDYYRERVREFQVQLNALAETVDTVTALRVQLADGSELAASLDEWLADFYANRARLVAVASTVNTATNAADALGFRLPAVSVPQQLAALPAAVLALVAAAAAGIAWAVSYAISAVADARARVSRNELLASVPEDERAAAIKASDAIAASQAAAGNTWANVAGVVKWAAIGAAIWFGFRAWREG